MSLYRPYYDIPDPYPSAVDTTSNHQNSNSNQNAVKYRTIMEIVTREKKKERSEVFKIEYKAYV